MTSAGLRKSAAIIAAVLLASSAAWAFELENLVGKKQDKAHEKLSEGGYSLVHTEQKKKRAHEFWWNAKKKKCARLSIDLNSKHHKVLETTKVDKKKCKAEG
jgi:hypothetical protein